MAMFAKNRPTKRIDFEGGFVELQFLSKGVKDQITRMLSKSFEGFSEEEMKKIVSGTSVDVPPSMMEAVGKVQDVEYYKLSKAIKSWSEDILINEEAVKELSDDVYEIIVQEVNKMNGLNVQEEKN